MLAYIGIFIIGATVFYIVYSTQRAAEAAKVEDRLNIQWEQDEGARVFVPPFYLALTRPLLRDPYIQIATGFWKPEQIEFWKRQLVSAGMLKHVQPEHFVAAKFWLTLLSTLFTFLFAIFDPENIPAYAPLAVGMFAFFFPNMDLSSRRTERQTEIRLMKPYTVDLLTLSTEAGLDFMGAIGKVVERVKGPFVEELSVVLKDIQLGKSRAESLKGMSERVDMTEMTSFVATLVSAEAMGASVGPVLRAQSESMRQERLVRAEKAGAQASQKMLFPLVFFIMPAVFLMIFGPVVIQMVVK